MKISVVIIAKDEELTIDSCLATVRELADEIVVVVDKRTVDNTAKVAKKYGARVYLEDFNGFSEAKNFAFSRTNGDWVLWVDADERISKKLVDEIKSEVENSKFDGYELNRVNYFLGKHVRWGDRYPDYVLRLFKKENIIASEGIIHETIKINGSVGRLKSPLYHFTHRDIFSMVSKTINFSEYEANLRIESNHPPVVWWRLIRVFLTEFYNRIVRLQGWRQGTEGWIDGIFQAFSLFVVYARLWEKQRKPSLDETYKLLDKEILEGKL